MQNRINIDHTNSRAIAQEIGERLRAYLRDEPELPGVPNADQPAVHSLLVGSGTSRIRTRPEEIDGTLAGADGRTIAMRYFAAIAIVVSGLAVHSVVSLPPQKQSTPTAAQAADRLAETVDPFLLRSGG